MVSQVVAFLLLGISLLCALITPQRKGKETQGHPRVSEEDKVLHPINTNYSYSVAEPWELLC